MIKIIMIHVALLCAFLSDAHSDDLWERQAKNSPRLVNSFQIDMTGRIWTGNHEGLERFDGLSWIYYTPENSGLMKENVFTLAIDKNNILWIGYGLYASGGLTSFDGSVWKQYTTENSPLPNDFVSAVSVDKNNVKWIGTIKGLASLDDETWKTYTFSDDPTFMRRVYYSIVDNDNVKWFFWGRGLYNYEGIAGFDGETWTLYNSANCGLRSNYISSMAVDDINRKWFAYGLGDGGGVTCFDGKDWVSYTTENSGLCNDTVLSIAIDHNNVLWCGTMNGISCFDGKIWKTYQEVKVSSHEPMITFTEIDYIGVERDNSKWFDTSQGSWRFKEDASTDIQENSIHLDIYPFSVSPNPFNPSTTISFSLPSAARATLAVFDITGRTVRTLVSGSVSAGNHSVVWDGRDASGRTVSSGVYFARLESGNAARTMKMLLMR